MTEIEQFYVEMDCDEPESPTTSTTMPPPVPELVYTAEQRRAAEVLDRMVPIVMSSGFCALVTDPLTGITEIVDVPDTQS